MIVKFNTYRSRIDHVICTSPNQEPSPSKRVGSFFELAQIPWGGDSNKAHSSHPPLGGGLWARTCAVWCWLMHGSYGQGAGTNGGRLRVFSSAQAPWRMLLQALDRHQILESGIWDSIVRYKSERGVLDKSKISRGGSLF